MHRLITSVRSPRYVDATSCELPRGGKKQQVNDACSSSPTLSNPALLVDPVRKRSDSSRTNDDQGRHSARSEQTLAGFSTELACPGDPIMCIVYYIASSSLHKPYARAGAYCMD